MSVFTSNAILLDTVQQFLKLPIWKDTAQQLMRRLQVNKQVVYKQDAFSTFTSDPLADSE